MLSLVDTLVELHAVDPAEVGLADFGRPEGFLDRQLRRWGKQLDASRNRDLAGIDELHATLGRRLPQSPAATVVHGDYRLDNVLMGDDDEIKAILDWEMSTLGDPLTDLGLLVMYSMPLGMPDSPSPRPPRPRATRIRPNWSRGTPSAPGGTSPRCPGTRRSPGSSSP